MARDLEQLFRDNKLCDFTIHVGDRQIQVHKAIIAARSPVFAAMLEPHTEESQNNCVHVDDVDVDVRIIDFETDLLTDYEFFQVVQEMLYYTYSGRSPNLKDMAAELLGVADRFALTGLKEMAEQVRKLVSFFAEEKFSFFV